jgi:hypothetical protein
LGSGTVEAAVGFCLERSGVDGRADAGAEKRADGFADLPLKFFSGADLDGDDLPEAGSGVGAEKVGAKGSPCGPRCAGWKIGRAETLLFSTWALKRSLRSGLEDLGDG